MSPRAAGAVVTRAAVPDLDAAPVAQTGRRGANAGAVLRTVLHHGPIARSTIARITGLSPAAVTGHCADLAAAGLLRELPDEVRSNGAGRPHIPVAIDVTRHLVAAVHIAVPQTTVALLDLRGRVLASDSVPHQCTDPDAVVRRAAQALAELCAAHGGARPAGIGVAIGGWVEAESGTVMDHPRLGWSLVPLRAMLSALTGLPVHVDNHSRALLHGEILLGRAHAAASVLHVFVGNVVDAAFATRGEAHHGAGSQAGAIAHLPVEGSDAPCSCGRTGCLEATVSESTLTRRAVAQGLIRAPDYRLLLAAAIAADPGAVALLVERARLVGRAVALLIDVFGPELAVVTDPAAAYLPDVLAALRGSARDHLRTVREDVDEMLVPTGFRGIVLETAGAAVILDALYRDPLRTISS
ncbi:ROK family transcriptional regulator [Actinospica durhamensis]|uniref:ROK family transcriptional regulator n=1 Tax=Actinospica durhamensis TaxID=1508375 RepID=A0A941EJX5_9ACTN|nr:ROK family transcriptional regulator [Actinospica durhamensis]MBR7833855.1 ROK family transcriptional regulator [Actinospica durhamensis]